MSYYKPLDNLNTVDVVQFNKIGIEEDGKFGKYRQCEVIVNRIPMLWSLSLEKYENIIF